MNINSSYTTKLACLERGNKIDWWYKRNSHCVIFDCGTIETNV